MELKWKNGLYHGETEYGIPNGEGVLLLENGIQRGRFENGEIVSGCEYIGDTLYVGEYKNGLYHGNGYMAKDYGYAWEGLFECGRPNGPCLPNAVFLPRYYGNLEPRYLDSDSFPHCGKMGEPGYMRRTELEKFGMTALSERLGYGVACAVVKRNNRREYSKALNDNIMLFTDRDDGNIYIDGFITGWDGEEFVPLTPEQAYELCTVINEELLKRAWDYDEIQLRIRNGGYALTDEGIYRGELDENGAPTGVGRLVYDFGDKDGRAFVYGKFECGRLTGHTHLYYRLGAPEGIKYVGSMKDGRFDGNGSYDTVFGGMTGVFVDGLLEGDDCRLNADGKSYRGKFVGGRLVFGTLTDGEWKYEGPFENMLPHGIGKETEGGRSQTGYFLCGKKVLSDGGKGNVIEIFDPGYVKELCFESFEPEAFAMLLNTDGVKLVVNENTEKLGKNIAAVVSDSRAGAKNSFASELLGEEIYGGCLIVGFDGRGACELPASKLASLEAELKKTASLIAERLPSTFKRVLIHDAYENKSVTTRETHDDYPLEGYDINRRFFFYVLTVGGESYCLDYTREITEMFDAYDKEKDDELKADASARIHKLPDGLSEYEAVKKYVDAKREWTELFAIKTVRSTQSGFGSADREALLFDVLKLIFGKEMTEE